jgi:hypothetical protein
MFCSTSITLHLARGLGAAALLFAALWSEGLPIFLRLSAAAGALVLMRGCPMCWLVGLFETATNRLKASVVQPKAPTPSKTP